MAEVRVALTDLGYDVVNIAPATEHIQRAAVMDVELATGERLRVDAFGRDQRDARIAAKVWHKAMYHDPGVPVFGSRVQQVEHIGYTLMLAERALVPAARFVRTGVGGADAAVLVTMPPRGTPIASLPVERVTDAVLRDAWKQLDALHRAGIAHGNIDGLRVVVDDDGAVAFDDFSSSDASDEQYWVHRDDAALLVLTAQLVGNERAIAAMVATLGKERAGAVIPVVQPAALPAASPRASSTRARPSSRCAPTSRPRPAPKTSRRSRSSASACSTSGCSSASSSPSASPSTAWRGSTGPRSRASSRTPPGRGRSSRSSCTRWCRRRGPPRSWAASTRTCRSSPPC